MILKIWFLILKWRVDLTKFGDDETQKGQFTVKSIYTMLNDEERYTAGEDMEFESTIKTKDFFLDSTQEKIH